MVSTGIHGVRIPLSPLALHANHAPPLGIQAGMAYFRLMWQGSPDIAHSQLKGTLNSNKINHIQQNMCHEKFWMQF